MGNFNKGNKFSGGRGGKKPGGRSFGGDRGGKSGFSGGRDGDRPEMHNAKCSDCGNNCEVPFRPTGNKPVFCSDCFKNKGSDNSRDSRDGGKRDFGGRDSRPRFADKYPSKGGDRKGGSDYKAQFDILNTKLDKILRVLNPDTSKESSKVVATESKKFKKTPKKEVDTVALGKIISKAVSKKPASKKVSAKKVAKKKTKKTTEKKKTSKKKK
jgi:CxxC-x17-CxxC domain-containing protein